MVDTPGCRVVGLYHAQKPEKLGEALADAIGHFLKDWPGETPHAPVTGYFRPSANDSLAADKRPEA
jgi:hypothetical protein